MQTDPLVVERTYNAPAQKVWKAITDVNQMKHWYFDFEDFKPEVGFTFQFYGGSKELQYLHICEVTEVIDGEKLTHSWKYDGYEGISYVTWQLFPEGENTRLVLTHTGLETFPPLKDFGRESFAKGWNHILGKSLKEFLEA